VPSSNYPNGFSSGITIRGIPLVQSHPGRVFWVGNASAAQLSGHKGASDGNKGAFDAPFSTLDTAIGKCVTSRGDIIFVKPGHAETISSATALAADVAGVAIIGLGIGSLRPAFTFDTATTATIPVSAANVTFKNCIFTANFADIVSVFTLTTAKYFTLEDCYVKATATNMNFIHVIDTNATTADANGLYIDNLKWIEPDGATLALALVDGTNDDWELKNSYLNLGGTTTVAMGFTIATGKVLTNLKVTDNIGIKVGQTDGSAGVWMSTDGSTNTGYFARNYSENTDPAGNILMTATSGIGFGPDNYHSGEQNEHGVAITTAFNNA
jgi:hypothetical protein